MEKKKELPSYKSREEEVLREKSVLTEILTSKGREISIFTEGLLHTSFTYI